MIEAKKAGERISEFPKLHQHLPNVREALRTMRFPSFTASHGSGYVGCGERREPHHPRSGKGPTFATNPKTPTNPASSAEGATPRIVARMTLAKAFVLEEMAERRAFRDWLEQSEEYLRIYRDIEALWRDLGDIGTVVGPQLAAARAYLHPHLSAEEPTPTAPPGARAAWYSRARAWAVITTSSCRRRTRSCNPSRPAAPSLPTILRKL